MPIAAIMVMSRPSRLMRPALRLITRRTKRSLIIRSLSNFWCNRANCSFISSNVSIVLMLGKCANVRMWECANAWEMCKCENVQICQCFAMLGNMRGYKSKTKAFSHLHILTFAHFQSISKAFSKHILLVLHIFKFFANACEAYWYVLGWYANDNPDFVVGETFEP